MVRPLGDFGGSRQFSIDPTELLASEVLSQMSVLPVVIPPATVTIEFVVVNGKIWIRVKTWWPGVKDAPGTVQNV